MMGHRAEQMMEHYMHLQEEDFTAIRVMQNEVFGTEDARTGTSRH